MFSMAYNLFLFFCLFNYVIFFNVIQSKIALELKSCFSFLFYYDANYMRHNSIFLFLFPNKVKYSHFINNVIHLSSFSSYTNFINKNNNNHYFFISCKKMTNENILKNTKKSFLHLKKNSKKHILKKNIKNCIGVGL
ncbi:MAG: hypothetical protein U0T61_01975 [Buchnera aphidicola (Melaphis rhois)]